MAFQDILVPTDFQPGSRSAIERAVDSLGPEGGRVVVLHVIDQRLMEHTLALFPEVEKATLLTRLHQQAHEQYARLMSGFEDGKITLDPLIVEGVPFLKIVQMAHDLDADMIVMAMHRGLEHVEHVLFGSTAERVLRLTPIPVLIVPTTMSLGEATPQS